VIITKVAVVELQNILVLYKVIVLRLCKLSFMYRKMKTEHKLPCFCQSHNMDIYTIFMFFHAVGVSACDVIGCSTCTGGYGYQCFGRTWCEVHCTSPSPPSPKDKIKTIWALSTKIKSNCDLMLVTLRHLL
jgi:hypothetical protein